MSDMISLVVPVYNEGREIYHNLRQILEHAQGDSYLLEMIAVNDGSTDNTEDEILRLCGQDPRVRLVAFTRNFGKEAAIHAGLAEAKGKAAITLDSDLQHPPELCPKMIRFWRDGYWVVHAIKSSRPQEGLGKKIFVRVFYGLFHKLSGLNIEQQSDYKLLDRQVIDAYLNLPERHLFFRGLISWAGFPSAQISFDVPERKNQGRSQWSLLSLVRYAITNLTNFSSMPLKVLSWLGVAILVFGGAMGSISLAQKFEGKALDGFTTVNLLVITIGGANMLGIGILGHYLARIYDEIKGRPMYFIKSK